MMPRGDWHNVAMFVADGASTVTAALPENDPPGPPVNDPSAVLPLTMVDVSVAFLSLTVPFQLMVKSGAAPVVNGATQFKGLLENDPTNLPFVMLTVVLLVLQADRVPLTVDGLDPPPVVFNRGKNDTLADRSQLTEPGAAPE